MQQYEVRQGTRVVILTEDFGKWSARLYLNHGDTATLQCWKGRSRKGAEAWARMMLAA